MRGQLFLDGHRWLRDLAQFAVDAERTRRCIVGLEVQVRRAHVDGVDEHLLQEATTGGSRPRSRRGCSAAIVGVVVVTSKSKSGPGIDSSTCWRWRSVPRAGAFSLSYSTITLRRQWVVNLMRSTASLVGGVGGTDEQAVARLPSTISWYWLEILCRRGCAQFARRRVQVQQRQRQCAGQVCARSWTSRRRRDEADTKLLLRFARRLRQFLGVLALSLPG